MGLLYYTSYLAVLAAFAFVTLSLASGLLYVSELIEEHSRLAKSIGQRGIYIIIALHAVFYFSDSLPLPQTLFSITCHVVYLQNFSHTWPLISLTSPSFLASCLLVIADHFLWFFYFARRSSEARHSRKFKGVNSDVHGFTEIATFFGICVWLAPLFLFLSLSANDNALPLSSAEPGSPTTTGMQTTKTRVSLVRSIFSFLLKPVRKDTSEGIIAPRSPVVPKSSLPPFTPPSPGRYSVPPRSPGPPTRTHESEVHLSPNMGSFKLGAAPRRSFQPQRRSTGDGLGLGLRKVTGPTVETDDF